MSDETEAKTTQETETGSAEDYAEVQVSEAETPAPESFESETSSELTVTDPVPVEAVPVKKESSREFLNALKCMISFFTIIRLDVGQKEFDAMEKNFWMAPALGFINGLVAMTVCIILGMFNAGIMVQAIAAIASMYIFSKFLHFDGLTDFGDGIIVSSGDRDKHIRALKDSLIGAGGFGVALMVVLITFACYCSIGDMAFAFNLDSDGNIHMVFGIGFVAFAAEILVKNAQVAAAAFGEPGNGMASRQVRCTTPDSLVRSTLLTVIVLLIATLVGIGFASMCDYDADFSTAKIIVLFMVSILLSVMTGLVMARVANRTFGFVNGDILGATNEISRAVILLISLMIIGVW